MIQLLEIKAKRPVKGGNHEVISRTVTGTIPGELPDVYDILADIYLDRMKKDGVIGQKPA